MRQFSAVKFRRGWSGVERFIRILRICGFVRPSSSEPSYAVLDVLDAEGDIIFDYAIPTAAAFRYVYRQLQLRVVTEDEVSGHGQTSAPTGRSRSTRQRP